MSIVPAGWTSVRIGDICSLKNGRAFKPTEWSATGLPIVRIQNLNNASAPFNKYDGEFEERYHLKGGELLFAWSGTPGTSFGAHIWRGGEALLNQHIFRVDFDEAAIDKRFLRRAINQKLAELIDMAHGGVGLRHVTKGKFEATEILLAPLAEQKRIADKLDRLLAAVETCKARLDAIPAILKRFRQSVLAAATSGELTEERRRDRDTREATQLSVGQLGEVITGSTPSTDDEANYGGDLPFFKPGDLDAGYSVLDARAHLSRCGALHSRSFPERTVMVTCIGATIGKVGLARARGATNQQINSVVCNEGLVLPEWLFFWFSSPRGQRSILENASATTLPILNKSRFMRLTVDVPPLEDQAEVVRRVETLFRLADELDKKIRHSSECLKLLRQRVLSKAFSGELTSRVEVLRERPSRSGVRCEPAEIC